MEITVFPQGFNVQPTQVMGTTGPIDGMTLMIIDAGGTAIKFSFPMEAWEQFQRFIADPEGETARSLARASIIGPNGLAPSLKQQH